MQTQPGDDIYFSVNRRTQVSNDRKPRKITQIKVPMKKIQNLIQFDTPRQLGNPSDFALVPNLISKTNKKLTALTQKRKDMKEAREKPQLSSLLQKSVEDSVKNKVKVVGYNKLSAMLPTVVKQQLEDEPDKYDLILKPYVTLLRILNGRRLEREEKLGATRRDAEQKALFERIIRLTKANNPKLLAFDRLEKDPKVAPLMLEYRKTGALSHAGKRKILTYLEKHGQQYGDVVPPNASTPRNQALIDQMYDHFAEEYDLLDNYVDFSDIPSGPGSAPAPAPGIWPNVPRRPRRKESTSPAPAPAPAPTGRRRPGSAPFVPIPAPAPAPAPAPTGRRRPGSAPFVPIPAPAPAPAPAPSSPSSPAPAPAPGMLPIVPSKTKIRIPSKTKIRIPRKRPAPAPASVPIERYDLIDFSDSPSYTKNIPMAPAPAPGMLPIVPSKMRMMIPRFKPAPAPASVPIERYGYVDFSDFSDIPSSPAPTPSSPSNPAPSSPAPVPDMLGTIVPSRLVKTRRKSRGSGLNLGHLHGGALINDVIQKKGNEVIRRLKLSNAKHPDLPKIRKVKKASAEMLKQMEAISGCKVETDQKNTVKKELAKRMKAHGGSFTSFMNHLSNGFFKGLTLGLVDI
jgi:hypothetical protein